MSTRLDGYFTSNITKIGDNINEIIEKKFTVANIRLSMLGTHLSFFRFFYLSDEYHDIQYDVKFHFRACLP